jgi:2-dehydro-3-deoxy-D-gluconate 5-dehydrogenase
LGKASGGNRSAEQSEERPVRAGSLFDLTGRVALITGATGGIGSELARGLGEAGATVALASRSQPALDAEAAALQAVGVKAGAFPADLSEVAECEQLVPAVIAEFGQLDILINVAGINRRKLVVEFTEADWDAVLDLNLKGLFFVSQAFGRAWIERRAATADHPVKGKIINIASIASFRGNRQRALYTASKAGVLGITRTLAVEWAPEGICVNAIAPGYIETELTRSLFSDPTFMSWLESRVPMQRAGQPRDLVGAAVFLASSASDYLTGQTIAVDGGFLANM